MPPDQRKRFKTLAASEGLSYAGLIIMWMDRHEDRLARQKRAQAHPLHQPTRKSNYPGGGV